MPDDAVRSVALTRTGPASFLAENARGGTLAVSAGSSGSSDFSPVELLLVGVAGCSGIDVDLLTSRLAEPESFRIGAAAEKVRDAEGNHLGPITVTVEVSFPAGEDGDAARARLPDAVAKSRDRLCTVSRTVQLATPVEFVVAPD
ncbi:MAG TPA: OsmC family protein [Ornithinimicrobium sp.]|nr:OsmC family protein [Ornithinimicrobium sp.]